MPEAMATKQISKEPRKRCASLSAPIFGKQEHYQWIDDRDLIFGRNGARHADAPFPRGWKFSYRLPDGFHYDIMHLEKAQILGQ